jgi:Tfp pilus assembly protein PilF
VTERMQKLEQMLQREPDDLFLLYAVAMEHRKLGNQAEAMRYLSQVLAKDPDHCAAHHQLAQVRESMGEKEAARQAYRAGIEAANRVGNKHARHEMQEALDLLE